MAKTGLLDFKNATTNKIAFDWVITNGPNVNWIRKARWVVDGKFYTSSGVTAGMDMTLDFLKDLHGVDVARQVAEQIEYEWTEDSKNDSFCKKNRKIGHFSADGRILLSFTGGILVFRHDTGNI